MRLPLACGLTAALVLAASAQAADLRHHRRHGVAPSEDAVALDAIAPRTRRGTALQTYGDAEIARARMQRRYARAAAEAVSERRTGGAPPPCDPRLATADPYVCRNDPRAVGYGQFYAFTPSHVSAPTVFEQDPRVQAPIMPDITGFFWSVNSARIDPH